MDEFGKDAKEWLEHVTERSAQLNMFLNMLQREFGYDVVQSDREWLVLTAANQPMQEFPTLADAMRFVLEQIKAD